MVIGVFDMAGSAWWAWEGSYQDCFWGRSVPSREVICVTYIYRYRLVVWLAFIFLLPFFCAVFLAREYCSISRLWRIMASIVAGWCKGVTGYSGWGV